MTTTAPTRPEELLPSQIQIRHHPLPPTPLIPNSPHPLLHYHLPHPLLPNTLRDLFATNTWETQWIYRYGPTQRSHYHTVHECMAVLSGTATIRFGAADTAADLAANTHGGDWEAGGVEIQAKSGDVFVLPAGTAHKTFDTEPKAEFALLTPGNGHGVEAGVGLDAISLEGFTMVGAYPRGCGGWDSLVGGEEAAPDFKSVWSVKKPERDPVLGGAKEGIVGVWTKG